MEIISAGDWSKAVNLVRNFLSDDRIEGMKSQVYPDSAGWDTIGVGHKLTEREISSGKIIIDFENTPYEIQWRQGLSLTQISVLLDQDLKLIISRIPLGYILSRVKVPLNTGQFATLASFVFNLGQARFNEPKCTFLRLLNEGKYEAVPRELRRWNKVRIAGVLVPSLGLSNRRVLEGLLWTGEFVPPNIWGEKLRT